MENVYALRGATTVDDDKAELIDEAVKAMMEELYKENRIDDSDICFVHFSQTKDLISRNAAAASRRGGYATTVPLFCTQEADTENSLKHAIRVLIMINHEKRNAPVMVYQNGAKVLRPDWNSVKKD